MPSFSRTGLGSLQETETDSLTSASDLFAKELVETSVISRKNCIARPNALSNTGPLHIAIPPEGDLLIDPASFRLHGICRVKKYAAASSSWVDLEAADATKVSPVNLFTKSIFKDIQTYIQQTLVTLVATPAYPLKAYLETVASFGMDAASGHLKCSYWEKDAPGKHDSTTDNPAFAKRHKIIQESRQVTIAEVLHTELTTMNKYILPGLDISFVLSLNEPGYYLQTSTDNNDIYQLQYEDLYIAYDRVELKPAILSSVETKLKAFYNVNYFIARSIIRSRQISAQEGNLLWPTLFTGALPETVTICMIDSQAFNGSKTKNMFNLQHFDIESLSLRVNSQIHPCMPLKSRLKDKDGIELYRHFQDHLGIGASNNPSLITYNDFIDGSTIIPFDLTPDRCALFHNHPKVFGNIELSMKFAKVLPMGVTILALCNYSDQIRITGPIDKREVLLNPHMAA